MALSKDFPSSELYQAPQKSVLLSLRQRKFDYTNKKKMYFTQQYRSMLTCVLGLGAASLILKFIF